MIQEVSFDRCFGAEKRAQLGAITGVNGRNWAQKVAETGNFRIHSGINCPALPYNPYSRIIAEMILGIRYVFGSSPEQVKTGLMS